MNHANMLEISFLIDSAIDILHTYYHGCDELHINTSYYEIIIPKIHIPFLKGILSINIMQMLIIFEIIYEFFPVDIILLSYPSIVFLIL